MKDQQVKVLLVEDQAAFADLLRQILTSLDGGDFLLTHSTLAAEAVQRLTDEPFDVVLLDLTLPDREGLDTYLTVKAAAPSVPVIVLTGFDDGRLALEAVRAGAQDYLVKGQIEWRMLGRVLRYAIERTRAAEALRHSEEFFRLISENVTDMIAVLDRDGRRLYNSPSYQHLLGNPAHLSGTDSFVEVHPEDQEKIRAIFADTVTSGRGHRTEYRLLLGDGSVRHIESVGNAIPNEAGATAKVVVVSRDITERKQTEEALRAALVDLHRSHEEIKTAQLQLVQSEKLEAVSTFAAGVAHEVKNPLQAIILGVDYLSSFMAEKDANALTVLAEMDHAVHRADNIIRGLLEFAAYSKRSVKPEDLSRIIAQALQSVEPELAAAGAIRLQRELADDLPPLRLDAKTMKHVFLNLFLNALRTMPQGGTLVTRTRTQTLAEARPASRLKAGDLVVVAEVEQIPATPAVTGEAPETAATGKPSGLGFTVLKKIIELYGGMIELVDRQEAGFRFTVQFKAENKVSP